jgi:pimeloyl-ACP methyl ester carboxylesterase
MAWTDLTDVRCCYEVIGRGDPLLLVPGLGVTRSVWEPIVPELAAHLSLLLVDNRGAGRSESRRPAELLRHYVADLIELMDYLQLDRAHVLGLSLGGVIARRLAADHPSRVDRLVLVSCTDQLSPYLRQIMGLLGGLARRRSVEAFARVLETLGTSPEFYDDHVHESEQRVREKCRDASPGVIDQQLACLAREAAGGGADPVLAPTLVVAGEYDPLIPACYARAMAGRIPGSRFLLVPGAGHNPLQECAERVGRELIHFLTQTHDNSPADSGAGPGLQTPQSREEGVAGFTAAAAAADE